MPKQSRVGDDAVCPSDSHGDICCSHSVRGPGIDGSPDVLANGQKVLRVQDPGKHSSCCGANSWVVAKGSRTVFFNGIPAARVGDDTTHCGGKGALVIGSDNVITGG